jgi:uncharacterized membrane protein
MSRGKRFESARRLSRFGVDKPVTWDASTPWIIHEASLIPRMAVGIGTSSTAPVQSEQSTIMSPNRYGREVSVLGEILHLTHVVLAGVWLGGLVFTTLVVSPALKAMKWPEAERVAVRSAIGRQYARVGGINLVLLALFALLDGALGGFGPALYAEYALILLLFGLVAAHGAYFGRRLAELARAERESENEEVARLLAERRRSLQEVSSRVSWVSLLVSTAVVVLATW